MIPISNYLKNSGKINDPNERNSNWIGECCGARWRDEVEVDPTTQSVGFDICATNTTNLIGELDPNVFKVDHIQTKNGPLTIVSKIWQEGENDGYEEDLEPIENHNEDYDDNEPDEDDDDGDF